MARSITDILKAMDLIVVPDAGACSPTALTFNRKDNYKKKATQRRPSNLRAIKIWRA